MIERCRYCAREHETGGFDLDGITVKECPDVEPDTIVGAPFMSHDWFLVDDTDANFPKIVPGNFIQSEIIE